MNAALLARAVFPQRRERETVPPPSGPRAVTAQVAPADEADAGSYSTIDLPKSAPEAGLLRVTVEASSSGQILASARLRPGQELVLGSAPEADVVIADPTVSGRHCAVAHQGGLVRVIDLGSRNGVRFGGALVDRAMCAATGAFEIGRAVVRLEALGAEGESQGEAPLPGVVGRSLAMDRLASSVRRIAALRVPVLLRGESGTGKDVVARALHAESDRRRRPFVALNAATIRPELAESELFGHERGAFTGALRERRGAFREAHTGTLFLDEIAALSLDVQAKLLRAVEEGTVRPLGGEAEHRADVRLLVATCEPLEAMVRERRFRADLYQRLAVCVIRVPALRERPEDIPALAHHLLSVSEVGAREIAPCAMSILRNHPWPGNVRELRNVLVQAAIDAPATLFARHIQEVLASREEGTRQKLTPADALRIFEEAGYNVSAAARDAELPRTTMRDLLRAAGAPLGVRKAG